MTALLVDDHSWIPEGYSGPAGLGEECAGAGAGPREVEIFCGGNALLVCVERVVFPDDDPPDVLVARDQVACFDPTLIPVRDADGRAVFPEMSVPFDPEGTEKAVRAAEKRGLAVRTGFLAGIRGPALLTPAERTALQSLGADAVCGWLHLAVRRARAAGIAVVGIGLGANPDAETIRALLSDLV